MRISDWSSDVCSSDLAGLFGAERLRRHETFDPGDLVRVRHAEAGCRRRRHADAAIERHRRLDALLPRVLRHGFEPASPIGRKAAVNINQAVDSLGRSVDPKSTRLNYSH